MPLEATILCLDNSEFMRNGDYSPTRFEAQRDAVNIIANAKTQSNPESTVALLKMAGGPQTLATLSTDVGRILQAMHKISLKDDVEFCKGLRVAALCLKHRQNKNQRQRIIAFVGSPILDEKKDMVKLAKRLKKNNVAVDVINFGEDSAANTDKLEAFSAAVDSGDNCHLLTVPPGPHHLGDMVMSSPIVLGDNAGAMAMDGGSGVSGGGGGGGAGFAEFGGIDPNMDPELAMALRMSMEEERARAEAANADGAEKDKETTTSATSTAEADTKEETTKEASSTDDAAAMEEDDELAAALAMSMEPTKETKEDVVEEAAMEEDDDELAAALAMSMGGASADTATAASTADNTASTTAAAMDEDDELAKALALSMSGAATSSKPEEEEEIDEDALLAAALAMSKETPSAAVNKDETEKAQESAAKKAEQGEEEADPAADATFLQSVLADLPGVDPNDPQIQSILAQFKKDQENAGGKK